VGSLRPPSEAELRILTDGNLNEAVTEHAVPKPPESTRWATALRPELGKYPSTMINLLARVLEPDIAWAYEPENVESEYFGGP
tara:strand:- start:16 stop:264 length:249 start_codon:yes stop_codon:yes gene_type:complete